MSDLYLKHVEFHKWCESCEYEENAESEPPCDECLEIPAREGSKKPEKWVEKKDGGSKAHHNNHNKESCSC